MCLCRDDTNNQGYSPLINNRSELHPWPYIEDNSISRSSTPDPKLPENSSPRIENSKGTEQTDTSSAGDCRNSSSLGSENIKIHNTTSDSKYGLNSGNENKGEVIQHDNTSGSDSGLGYSSAGNVDRRRVIQHDTTSGSDSGYCSSDVNVNRRIVQHDTTNGRPKLKSCVESVNELAKEIFDDLIELTVDSSGTVYHCNKHGVTLVIPEGAVSQLTTVWYGARLLCDKFQFQGDYVPVSPIVWVHTSHELIKRAELYIPHYVDITDMSEATIKADLHLLTAEDDNFLSKKFFHFERNVKAEMTVESSFAKIMTYDFCSICTGASGRAYRSILKRYFIAAAEKKDSNRGLFVEFIFFYQLKSCKEMVEKQCEDRDYSIQSFIPVTLTGNKQISLDFDKSSLSSKGWDVSYFDFNYEYIQEKNIDYYYMMGCEENGDVTEENLARLELLEETLTYPPRFKLKFSLVKSSDVEHEYHGMSITFNNVLPPTTCFVSLDDKWGILPISPPPSPTIAENDQSIIDIIDKEEVKIVLDKFGIHLGIAPHKLEEINKMQNCCIQVFLHWRSANPEASWEPIAEALHKSNLKELAHEVRDHFVPQPAPQEAPNGVHCFLCQRNHFTINNIPESILLRIAPEIRDLSRLVGAKIEDKYHSFGIQVGLEPGFLKGLLHSNHSCQDKFSLVFSRWKDSSPDTYTWKTVIDTLQSPTIKANYTALNVIDFLAGKR